MRAFSDDFMKRKTPELSLRGSTIQTRRLEPIRSRG
jgi:hypothetical protein